MEPQFSTNIANEQILNNNNNNNNDVKEIITIETKTTKDNDIDNNLTISTKLSSTDQLICKTPQDSPTGSSSRSPSRSMIKEIINIESTGSMEYLNKVQQDNEKIGSHRNVIKRQRSTADTLIYLGLLQMLFGCMMVIFGVLVLVHDAALSQICGGIWGGCVAMTSGLLAIGAAARECCPLRPKLAKLALTGHLAFSLVSLAVANLVLVFAAIGIVRDLNRTDVMFYENVDENNTATDENVLSTFTVNNNWPSILANIGLLVSCTCQVVTAAISSWRCARLLCPCFQIVEKYENHSINGTPSIIQAAVTANPKDILVSAWLGNQQAPSIPPASRPASTLPRPRTATSLPPSASVGGPHPLPGVYIVSTAPRKVKKQLIPAPLRPLPVPPQMLGYPIIPPPNYIMPPHVHKSAAKGRTRHPYGSYDNIHQRRRKRIPSDQQLRASTLPHKMSQQRHEKRQRKHKDRRGITEEEVVRTYTGLDRTIAEQFIVHCDSSRNQSSIVSKSDESGPDTSLSVSENASNDFLVEKL